MGLTWWVFHLDDAAEQVSASICEREAAHVTSCPLSHMKTSFTLVKLSHVMTADLILLAETLK